MNQNQNQGQPRQYTEVASGGSDNPRWEPTKNENNPDYPKQIEGYFKKFTELPGKNGSFMVAEIQMMNNDGSVGQCIDVSGGKVLENKLREIPMSSWVMIQYLGKVQGKNNTYNDWKTFVDENVVPLHQVLGLPAPIQNNAFGGQQQQNNTPAQNNGFGQQQQNPFGGQQQQNNAFGNTQAFNQQAQSNAPTFNQTAPAQNNPFVQQQANNQAPAFNQNAGQQQTGGNGTWTPPQNTGPVFNQNAPAQNNGFGQQQQNPFGGQQQSNNPFQQQKDDLPF